MQNELADHQAERAVLAAVMLDDEKRLRVLARVARIIRESDFHLPQHATVFAAMLAVDARGEPIDMYTLRAELFARKCLEGVGGHQFLSELTETLPTLAHAESHAGIVLRMAKAREALRALAEARSEIVNGALNADDVVARGMERLSTVWARNDRIRERTIAHHVDDALEGLLDSMAGGGREIPTGLRAFDGDRRSGELGATGGMFDGELWVISAETSGGKTALALQIARNVAQTGRRVLLFSFEMDARRIVWRLTAPDHRVPMTRIKRGQVDPDEVRSIQQAADRLRDLPIEIHGTCTIEDIEGVILAARARSHAGEELGLVVVDYLNLIPATPRIDDRKDDRQRIERYTRRLKTIAQKAAVPVMLLCQFTREGNRAGRPTKHDLKGSGSIEADADVIVLLHVDEDVKTQSPRPVLFMVAKNRDAKLCEFTLAFDGDAQAFGPVKDDDATDDYRVGGFARTN